MSRYTLSETPDVVAGYDQPLGMFFAHVYDTEDELLAGCDSADMLDVLAFVAEVVPDWTVVQRHRLMRWLLADMTEGWEPGPLQRAFGFTGRQRERNDHGR